MGPHDPGVAVPGADGHGRRLAAGAGRPADPLGDDHRRPRWHPRSRIAASSSAVARSSRSVRATSAGATRAARTVDAADRFVIPGLWDMHVHFGGGNELVAENQALLPLYVAHGVTTVRDAAADLAGHVLAWRRAIAEDALLGPTIFTSGPKLEGYRPSWKGTLEVGTPDGSRLGARPAAGDACRLRQDHRQHAHAGDVSLSRCGKPRGAVYAPRLTCRWRSRSSR